SSLAFNTLYAEGQRRYVESLSAYARQFLDQLEKPDVDFIEGLSPAIAIEQRSSAPNPRSTIATTTEIYDYLRILYAAAGQPHDPATGERIHRTGKSEIVAEIAALPERTKVILLAPIARDEVGDLRPIFERLKRQGFVRVRVDGEILELDDELKVDRKEKHSVEAVIDHLVIRDGIRTRLMDSVETALRWSSEEIEILVGEEDGGWRPKRFTTAFANPATGFKMPELTPKHFSFNSHSGACPRCHGLGTELIGDPSLLVPDDSKSIADGAVKSWWARNKKLKVIHDRAVSAVAGHFKVPLDVPFSQLPEPFKQALFYGTGDVPIRSGTATRKTIKPYEGLLVQAQRLHEESESETTRRNVRRYMNAKPCPKCAGKRLRPEILGVTITSETGELGIHEMTALPIEEAASWIAKIELNDQQTKVTGEVVNEIRKRLSFLNQVGLGYLSLDRQSGTLSGGEAQRIRLATQIGSGLAGVLYVLDEPSIGLHQFDNQQLIGTLESLRDLGNSVIVVEHDEETIRAADHVIDIGPGAGPRGGEIMAEGTPDEVAANPRSPTGKFLSGEHVIAVPKRRVSPPPQPASDVLDSGWLSLIGATENNLQNVDAHFPVGCFTCVTGKSGSGKSTLVDDILRRSLFRTFYQSKDSPGEHSHIEGLKQFDKAIVIDQSPIGRSPRSNPATYVGVFTLIRDLFAQLPTSKVRGYTPGRFSFNVAGGRCETCQGDGLIKIDMHFLSDVYVTCETCGGKRYNRDTLEITLKGKNIAEVLDQSIDEACQFFARIPKIYAKLHALSQVGLGYLKLGQSATTLSGGEAQRIKLAGELGKRATGRTLYLLDEPTTGLHFSDIETLLGVFMRLRDSGNTLIVIEHNLDVIKCADWVIDLGPGGGTAGGKIVAEGPPEAIADNPESLTGQFLARVL
ncbi:MAG: excinuclease ABC subunit UvrA, partial [Verrucomicrobiales bacterium]